MATITNCELTELIQNGSNYLTWASDMEVVLAYGEPMRAIGNAKQLVTSNVTHAGYAQPLRMSPNL